MIIQKLITKECDILVCDICLKEIDLATIPYTIEKTRLYDGGGRIKNFYDSIFKIPRKKKEFHFHHYCIEKAIFSASKLK